MVWVLEVVVRVHYGWPVVHDCITANGTSASKYPNKKDGIAHTTRLAMDDTHVPRHNLPTFGLILPPHPCVAKVFGKGSASKATGHAHANRHDSTLAMDCDLGFGWRELRKAQGARTVEFQIGLLVKDLAKVIGENKLWRNQCIQQSQV